MKIWHGEAGLGAAMHAEAGRDAVGHGMGATRGRTRPMARGEIMRELIAKLEQAKKGSRDLNGEIWAIADAEAWERQCWFKGRKYGGHVHTLAEKREHSKRMAAYLSPPYTTSLDAALTLVPDRHRWLLDRRPYADSRPDGYRAEVYKQGHPYKSDRSDVPQAWAATPALALCIAALKARAESTPNPSGEREGT